MKNDQLVAIPAMRTLLWGLTEAEAVMCLAKAFNRGVR